MQAREGQIVGDAHHDQVTYPAKRPKQRYVGNAENRRNEPSRYRNRGPPSLRLVLQRQVYRARFGGTGWRGPGSGFGEGTPVVSYAPRPILTRTLSLVIILRLERMLDSKVGDMGTTKRTGLIYREGTGGTEKRS